MFYVYVLKSRKDKKTYVGYTSDLERRVKEHNQGSCSSTKGRMPLDLVYYEAYRSGKDARVREKRLKQFRQGYVQLKKRIAESLER